MSEVGNKSRNRAQVLEGETRCIYCSRAPDSLEHMPPLVMFKDKLRPSGLEFGCCTACNHGTRAADIAAAFIARLEPDAAVSSPLLAEARRLMPMMEKRAPGLLGELMNPAKASRVAMRTPGGLIQPKVGIRLDGPIARAHLNVFAAKVGMGLYREHIGAPLPLDGAVFSVWFLNAGLARSVADSVLEKLPVYSTLTQGKTTYPDQFGYRFNCDGKTILAAVARFHKGLYVFTIAMAEPARYPFLVGAPHPTASYLRPGDLVGHLVPGRKLLRIIRPRARL
jgi:hypothetical protein